MTPYESTDAFERSDKDKNSIPVAEEGLKIEHHFSTAGVSPFDQVTWEKRSARIKDEKGEVIFEQDDIEVPSDWSQLATNVVVSKYFYGEKGRPEREHSVRQLVHRVTRTVADWGKADGVFATDEDAERFYQELTYLCVNQYGSFNSPVWFNVGLLQQYKITGSEGNYHWDATDSGPVKTKQSYAYPQASACFIQSVKDNMEDIMRLAKAEAMLFKYGSGTGTDLSTLRSSREKLAGGGRPSGPLSFMRVFDQIAGVVKSGGKTRRAAKMQSLRVTHPDIREFIECKLNEEKKARALVAAGYDGGLNGDAYSSVMYQNANLSVRITDEFMQAAQANADWHTYAVTEPAKIMGTHKADELLTLIAEGTRVCGDPGVQYHSTINRWNTCTTSGEICASNPCSEYMFLNDSACNLSSLNLLKFRRGDGSFDVESFRIAVRIFTIAQEILVDHSSYPSELICRNSHEFRPLGLGYANLGSLIMSLGLPYDSDDGRAYAAAVTAVMTATAYKTSAELASRVGTFAQFRKNRSAMLRVIRMHRQAVAHIPAQHCPAGLLQAAGECWDEALAAGEAIGYRNAQVTVLAPTGTIGFMMDCDTTGIEPDIALVKYKLLAGGGMFKIVNRTVPLALERLGYSKDQIAEIIAHIDEQDTIEGAPGMLEEHLSVFDCAFKPAKGTRSIHYMGHIRMMGAVQPFLSGAISKTVNMPKESTTPDIKQVYVDAWKLGLKAVAIYRDGSKSAQPVNVTKDGGKKQSQTDAPVAQVVVESNTPHRHRLPHTRPSITHKFDLANHEGYLNVGLYEDGTPGELFITMAKEGSTVGGMMDAFATAISLCLQYGVPLEALVKKFSHQRFEPSGMTSNRDIPFAKSIVDYIFRWLGMRFLEEYRQANMPDRSSSGTTPASTLAAPEAVKDDVSSVPGRAKASDTEGQGLGALFGGGSYKAEANQAQHAGSNHDGNGHGDNGHGGNGHAQVRAGNNGDATGDQAQPIMAAIAGAAISRPGLAVQRVDQQFSHYQEDAPACDVCGSITVRNGNCYKCFNCGSSLGCS
jgi:ribonucleoside-diphosphate reductase alpha chain